MSSPIDVVHLLKMPLMQLYGIKSVVSDIVSGLVAVFAWHAFAVFTFLTTGAVAGRAVAMGYMKRLTAAIGYEAQR
ncbi:hypothetical protein [Larsenimonas rhizosphaerae]|uniref:Uncharacterized protein n=1 Tax=Larsenimonas rhizosphaerae TaxID=2944682 RepID=A0AA41ZEY3_9GAMM|nr:hypothetical protein [Larsenimonas rhizosphaerae]MCX2522914.1 hypothetical protein [Larsenimonas rhizosphaerae]